MALPLAVTFQNMNSTKVCFYVYYDSSYNGPVFFVSYGCEVWPLALKEKQRLTMLENVVLSNVFGPKGSEVTVKRRRLRKKEACNLYSSPNIEFIQKE
jgi:hypothetical protein